MVVEACADANPCNVGYIWSVKAAALDQELKKAFDEATSVNPNIKVVAEGESFYTTPAGLAGRPEHAGGPPRSDRDHRRRPGLTGAVTAVKDAGVADKVKLVGYGGGAIAFQGIAAGERYGTVMQAPARGRPGHEDVHRRHPCRW
jgi:ribose transport system substrate-binding protein